MSREIGETAKTCATWAAAGFARVADAAGFQVDGVLLLTDCVHRPAVCENSDELLPFYELPWTTETLLAHSTV